MPTINGGIHKERNVVFKIDAEDLVMLAVLENKLLPQLDLLLSSLLDRLKPGPKKGEKKHTYTHKISARFFRGRSETHRRRRRWQIVDRAEDLREVRWIGEEVRPVEVRHSFTEASDWDLNQRLGLVTY
jgi:hypothetical protein